MTPRAVRAVLFDAGDTLIRLRGEPGALLRTAAERLGIQVEAAAAAAVWRRVLAGAGTPEELAKGRDLSPQGHRAVWTELYRRCGADDLAPGLSSALYELTVDPRSWEAFPDTTATLRRLHERGVPVGILSDTGFDLRPALSLLGLDRWVDAVVLSCDTGTCKPDPRTFRTACAQLGVEEAVTLMVGDNPLTDGGAAAAGLLVLLLPPPAATGPRGLGHVLPLLGQAPT
ncbi:MULTISPECIES: HAD family hydrolase [unclassified Geodermatophilus]|uniref:HAD family hydrolase n=1 Tax=unclassified Geodermatophilus TaxID=2637632 RepID=UPI003EEF4F84